MTQTPFDLHSHLAWLREKELEAHKNMSLCTTDVVSAFCEGRKHAFRECIDHIEKQPKELHRCMVPVGWDDK